VLLGNGLSKPTDNVGQQLNDKFWGGFSQLGFFGGLKDYVIDVNLSK
jgi:hypothetical protein